MASDQALDSLLSAARSAEPNERIAFRDPIAAHGDPAIDALAAWLADPRLSAFAVLTITQAGLQGSRERALAALDEVDASKLTQSTTRDVARAINRLSSGSTRVEDGGTRGPTVVGLPSPGRSYSPA